MSFKVQRQKRDLNVSKHVVGLVHATGVHKHNTVHVHKFAPQRKARFWCNSTG